MKKVWIALLMVMCFVGLAAAQDYLYYGTLMPIDGGESPAGVALKSDGDLYYVTFNAASSDLVYVQDAVGCCQGDPCTSSVVSTETLPTGRGLNDVDLDSAGNIYINGTGSSGADTVLKKFSAAPAHTEVWSATDERINGIELMNDDILAVSVAWNKIKFKSTSDGVTSSTSSEVSGGSNYQRSIALNPGNNDLYVGKNGANSLAALKVFSGGSVDNASGYSLALDNQLATLGVNSLYGVATQPVCFDGNNGQLIAVDKRDELNDAYQGVRIYNVSGTGGSSVFTEAQYIDGSTAPGRTSQYYSVGGVAYAEIGGLDFIAIAATYGPDYVIDIFRRPPTSVDDWHLY